ncbi:MAG: DUF1822 family protein [Symploca sp. SIO2E6]|nr:DUF1822 family protein [Symploca sp. SIO2E6]
MTNYLNEQKIAMTSFPGLQETIELEAEQKEEALQITNRLAVATGQLALYFQALALVAFEDWLKNREPSLSVEKTEASLFNPDYAQAVNAVFNLRVGEFKICLIPTLGFSDELVTIPQEVLAVPEFAAHFYLIIGIEDELDLAAIRGVARYDQLAADIAGIAVQADGSYELPVTSFSPKIEEVLVYLQCLSPATIKLPAVSTNRDYLEDLREFLSQQAVNAGQWIQGQVGSLVQGLDGQLIPAVSPLRQRQPATMVDINDILDDRNIEVPPEARVRFQDFNLAGKQLHLFTLVWPLATENEWCLLLILTAPPEEKLPPGVRLRVTDFQEVIVEEQLQNDYILTQIAGNHHEKFLVTIITADGEEKKTILFEFRP